MNTRDIAHLCQAPHLLWDGDNSDFILGTILPALHLSDADKQVVEWAYTAWPELDGKTYEQDSDGETVVRDMFVGGAIKCPAGVVHDTINRMPHHQTPDGKVWTRMESNGLYLRVAKSLGYTIPLRWRRYLFLSATWFWWR